MSVWASAAFEAVGCRSYMTLQFMILFEMGRTSKNDAARADSQKLQKGRFSRERRGSDWWLSALTLRMATLERTALRL